MNATEPFPLDRVDRLLLRLLQQNSRRRLRSLAAELGVSAPTCLRRIRRLESQGVIRAHSAVLDAARVGYGVMAFVEISLTSASGSEMAAFERRMVHCREVVQCSELAGEVDYLLTVLCRDMAAFSIFTRMHFADDRRVRSYRSLLVLRQTKSVHLLPV